MDDLLSSAILKITEKHSSHSVSTTTTPEPHTTIMPLLNVFDLPDDETSEKIKFVYDWLSNNGGNPRDQIVSIQTKLGACNPNETWVGKIYKYCRLSEKANKDLQRYENTKRDINALSSPR